MGRLRCVVKGCSRKSTTDKDNPVKIFSIPCVRKYDEDITSRRRVLWLKRLNISDEEMPNAGVCDAHFISGKPSYYVEESNPDWAPTQNIGSKNLVSKSALARYNRRKKFQSMKAKKMDFLIKGNSIPQVDLQPSTVSGSSKIASLAQKSLSSKEVARKEVINHQMSGIIKKPVEMIEIVNENQLDIFWMHKQPVKNSSQVCYGKVIKLGEADNSNVTLNFNDPTPTLPVKMVACQNGGLGTRISQKNGESNRRPMVILPVENLASPLQQVICPVHEEYSLFISDSTTNDHDYCAKPTVQEKRHHIYMDHDYCQTLHLNGPSITAENLSESSVVLFQAESPMQNPLELSDTESCDSAHEVNIYRTELPSSACRTDSICDDFILPDDAQCSTCAQVAILRSELEQKSIVLEARSNDVNSLKRELELAKEHISNLRAQLEENTRTLWSCLSVNGQSS